MIADWSSKSKLLTFYTNHGASYFNICKLQHSLLYYTEIGLAEHRSISIGTTSIKVHGSSDKSWLNREFVNQHLKQELICMAFTLISHTYKGQSWEMTRPSRHAEPKNTAAALAGSQL